VLGIGRDLVKPIEGRGEPALAAVEAVGEAVEAEEAAA
jgi:hypothetical protein